MFAARQNSGGRLPLLKQGAPTESFPQSPCEAFYSSNSRRRNLLLGKGLRFCLH